MRCLGYSHVESSKEKAELEMQPQEPAAFRWSLKLWSAWNFLGKSWRVTRGPRITPLRSSQV